MTGTALLAGCACSRAVGATVHDCVIVGAGPMGLLAARALTECGREVTLVEAGQGNPDLAGGDALDVEAPDSLGLSRALGRGLGGTGRWWAGQCALPPPDDLGAEPARGGVAWPLTEDDLGPWARQALRMVKLETSAQRARARVEAAFPAGLTAFEPWPTVYMARHRLDRTWARSITGNSRVTLLTGSRVETIRPGPATLAVEVQCAAGHTYVVEARRAVLAMGAIGNASVLLRSRTCGLPVTDSCGRFLSEHLTVRVASIASDHPSRVVRLMGTGFVGSRRYWPKFALRAEARRLAQLPAVAADLIVGYRSEIASAREALTPRRGGGARPDFRALPVAARTVAGLALARMHGSAVDLAAMTGLQVQLNVEQPPRHSNRVKLQPDGRATVCWTVGDDDLRSIRRTAGLLAAQWPRDLGLLALLTHLDDDEDLRSAVGAAHHHSGTTRMGRSAADSVVDSDQCLHGDDRVVVLGSSVFPTAGWVNPTLLAWATSLRAVDRIVRHR